MFQYNSQHQLNTITIHPTTTLTLPTHSHTLPSFIGQFKSNIFGHSKIANTGDRFWPTDEEQENGRMRECEGAMMMEKAERMDSNNFIMSYPFNQKQPSYSVPPNFTPWSQSVGGLLGNSTPTLPFTPYSPFSFQHPFFIHQQNNFYNSNFTIPPTLSNFQPTLNKPQRPPAIRKPMPYSRPPQPSAEVIVISDDQEPSSAAKNLMAVVREKSEPQLIRPQFPKMLQKPRNEKEIIEGRRFIDQRDTLERRDPKLFKKTVRPEAKEEQTARDDLLAKKKKISKERSGYRLTEHLRQLMQVSRYREYRPDLIMVGPQFQAAIKDKQLYEERQAWLQARRENLQQRRHD